MRDSPCRERLADAYLARQSCSVDARPGKNDEAAETATAIFVMSSTDAQVELRRFADLLTRTQPREVVCDVRRIPPSLDAVETIARLQLAAVRANATITVSRASELLTDLLLAVGFDDVFVFGSW
jgi:hypothetical protein